MAAAEHKSDFELTKEVMGVSAYSPLAGKLVIIG